MDNKHNHNHKHSHNHNYGSDKKILFAFILNLFFSVFELIGGFFTNSVAIISDSIHDLGDAISIGISYFLEKISKRKPDNKYTYGYVRYSVLGAFITTVILITGSVFVIYNAIKRIINPVDLNYDGLIVFAVIGTVINFLAVYFTRDGDSLNQKSVNLHMLEDVLGWVVVLIGSIVIKFTGFVIIDSLMSIGVALFLLYESLKNLKEIGDLFLEKIPDDYNVDEIKSDLLKIEGIKDIHHVHIWSIDGISNCATMHVIVDKNCNVKNIKDKIKDDFKKLNINHVTIEVEDGKCEDYFCNGLGNNCHSGHSH